MVSINGTLYASDDDSFDLDLQAGEYVIRVRALADQINYKHSDFSEDFILIIHPDDVNRFINLLKEFLKREMTE